MPFSHHSHSGEFCRHAKGSLSSVVAAAVAKGFKTYGLSEHMPRSRKEDLYPEEADMVPQDLWTAFASYLSSASLLRSQTPQLSLLIGFESDLIDAGASEMFDDLDKVLEVYGEEVEYMVGSVHHVYGVPIDFDRPTFDRALALASSRLEKALPSLSDVERLFCAYFDAQHLLITHFEPPIIGHFDLCRLYLPCIRLDDQPQVWERVERNVREVVRYGGLFEVNTAAVRKGWPTPYPGPEVLRLIVELGGRLTLSDDSHGPAFVAHHYRSAPSYLRSERVQELWYLERSPSDPAPQLEQSGTERVERGATGGGAEGRKEARRKKWKVVARKCSGDWSADAFWASLADP